MIPSGMIIIPIRITARTTHTWADTRTTTTITGTATTHGTPVTVILLTIMAAMITLQIPAAGEDTAQWHGDHTPPLIPGASQAMHPEET